MNRRITILLIVLLLGSPTITYASNNTNPSPRSTQRIVYDACNNRLFMYGGYYWTNTNIEIYDETYEYNSDTWKLLVSDKSPPPRGGHGMIYLDHIEEIHVFGGTNETHLLDDLWKYDCNRNSWEEIEDTNPPPPIMSFGYCYDKSNEVVVLYGGYDESDNNLDDTYVYHTDEKTWTKMNPETSPPPLYGCELVYDPVSESILLFGGHGTIDGQDDYLENIWKYNYVENNWTEINVVMGPRKMYWQSTVLNEGEDEVIVFGGRFRHSQLDDTWVYSLEDNEWIEIEADTSPSPRFHSGIGFLPGEGSVILFGGFSFIDEAYFNDTWKLVIDNGDSRWEKISHTIEQDSINERIPSFSPFMTLLSLLIFTQFTIRSKNKQMSKL